VVLLVDAVMPIGVEELFGANQSERVEQLRTDCIVARLAAIERQQRQPRAIPAAQLRQDTAVLIIRMRRDMHHARRGLQLQQLLPRLGRAILPRNGLTVRQSGDYDSDQDS